MRRGEIWTISGAGRYAGKPRPAVIVQDNRFDATDSITVCGFTTNPIDAPLIRILVKPDDLNGLRLESRIMADKVMTVHKTQLGSRLGRLDDKDMARLNRAIIVFLGLAATRSDS
jgi:mRNA interferase MazF